MACTHQNVVRKLPWLCGGHRHFIIIIIIILLSLLLSFLLSLLLLNEVTPQAIRSCTVRLPGKEPRKAGELMDEYKEEIKSGGDKEKNHIMVTLMGDPNMGKSSVINTIFGKKVWPHRDCLVIFSCPHHYLVVTLS